MSPAATLDALHRRYRSQSSRSHALFEEGRNWTAGVAKGGYFYPPYPLTMARGEGCYLWDVDGHRYVDFFNHHTAQILGHNDSAVVAAVQGQLERGIALGAATGVETQIAREMCHRVPSVERIRFTNSGTEATLHAIRLARNFSQKPKIAKFEGGYHGSHDEVQVSVAPPLDQAGPADAPLAVPTGGGLSPNAAAEVVVLPYNDEAAVERLVEQHRDELACVLFDPKFGVLPQRPEFVRAIRQITRENGVLFIFDEIVSFRMGPGGLQGQLGIEPDLSCFGKFVGGGFPAGAFGGRADLMDLVDNSNGPAEVFQSGTFSAHPVVMAAGLAMLRQMPPQAYAHLNGLGTQLESSLNDLFERQGIRAQVVVTGSAFSIYFNDHPVVDYRSLAGVDRAMAGRVFFSLLNQGYFLSQPLGMCALSLPMEPSHIDGLVGAVEQAVQEA